MKIYNPTISPYIDVDPDDIIVTWPPQHSLASGLFIVWCYRRSEMVQQVETYQRPDLIVPAGYEPGQLYRLGSSNDLDPDHFVDEGGHFFPQSLREQIRTHIKNATALKTQMGVS